MEVHPTVGRFCSWIRVAAMADAAKKPSSVRRSVRGRRKLHRGACA